MLTFGLLLVVVGLAHGGSSSGSSSSGSSSSGSSSTNEDWQLFLRKCPRQLTQDVHITFCKKDEFVAGAGALCQLEFTFGQGPTVRLDQSCLCPTGESCQASSVPLDKGERKTWRKDFKKQLKKMAKGGSSSDENGVCAVNTALYRCLPIPPAANTTSAPTGMTL